MSPELFQKPIVICGCGNALFGDDGFGPAVIEHLHHHYQLPGDVSAVDAGTSIRDLLFDLIFGDTKPGLIIIVDAVFHPGRRPGDIFEIPVAAIPGNLLGDFSLHQFPTVNMLAELEETSGIEVRVVVAQTEPLPEEVHPGLSPAVEQAVPLACERIMALIGERQKWEKKRSGEGG
jgi:coenzyme F420 hydrogenase subunit delta